MSVGFERRSWFVLFVVAVAWAAAGETAGRVITVKADGGGDYPTIQAAIDAAVEGDEVLVERGRYAGAGNRDLDFRGKAIRVRSSRPDDDDCMRETVIDAEGQGVIARFVNDEGPGSVLEGFTVGAGDTSRSVRGEAGFFEFSRGARPTTRRLRNVPQSGTAREASTQSSFYDPQWPGWVPPIPARVWSGHNPYHQPASTTYYYGSGDVDRDGAVTAADVAMAQQMADYAIPWNVQADVNGDGLVDSTDVALISAAVNGGTLEGWWDHLTTRAQRNNWISKTLKLDKTDEHTYFYEFFVCHHFAYQTFVNFTYLRGDFASESTEYKGGQTVFNVPMYFVSIGFPTNHAINAVLVGDDPRSFEDWRFIESQNDSDVSPGEWNMRYGSTVRISTQVLHGNPEPMVTFQVEETGITQVFASGNLLTSRPAVVARAVDNASDLWNPRVIRAGNTGVVLFEKMREDQSRATAIHMGRLPFADSTSTAAVLRGLHFVRLLDTAEGPDGKIHLLWEGKSGDYRQNIFYAKFDPATGKSSSISQVTPGLRLASSGRIVVRPGGEVHVFWFENYGYSGSYDHGIHWSRRTGEAWTVPQKLAEDVPQGQSGDWVNRHFARYAFDCEVLKDGRVILVWVERAGWSFYLSQMTYDGAGWVSSRIEDTGWDNGARGVSLCRDSGGVIHLAYWRGDRQQVAGMNEGRGDVYHRMYNGSAWSAATVIDNSRGAACPHIAAGSGGRVYLIWERKAAGAVSPVWREYSGGTWNAAQVLQGRAGSNAWYPKIAVLRDGKAVAVWSSRSNDFVTIESRVVRTESGNPEEPFYPPGHLGDFDCDSKVNFADFGKLAAGWRSTAGTEGWDSLLDIGWPSDDMVDGRDLARLASNWLIAPEAPPQEIHEGFESGDFSAHPWQSGGDAGWRVVSDVSFSGKFSARSGNIGDDMTSVLELPGVEGSVVSFRRKVSSERHWDFLYFYVDGEVKGRWSGEEDWAHETFYVGPGVHTFTWIYRKDEIMSSGSDCAWIDDVRIAP